MEKTISEFAKELQGMFITDTRDNGEKFIKTIDNRPEWLQELIREAHGDMMPEDYKYQFVSDAIDYIADNGNDEELLDYPEIEPDCYTSDLTAWLNSDNRRVYYLTEVLEEMDIKDGFQALAAAQLQEKREVYNIILEGLKTKLEEENEEEEADDE